MSVNYSMSFRWVCNSIRIDGLACFLRTHRRCYKVVTVVEAYQGSWINFGGFFTQFSRCQQNPIYFSPREWNYYVDLWTWRYLLGYRRDREELFKVFRRWYCLEAAFVLAWQILAFPFPGYFIRIPFPRHDHVFTQCYTDCFTANIAEMLTHARAIGTRPVFPLPFAAWVRG